MDRSDLPGEPILYVKRVAERDLNSSVPLDRRHPPDSSVVPKRDISDRVFAAYHSRNHPKARIPVHSIFSSYSGPPTTTLFNLSPTRVRSFLFSERLPVDMGARLANKISLSDKVTRGGG